ncbi:MAG: thioredoxin [Bacilli bacterium]|nr:thioredoxin [Bacilli bacterium]
MSVVEIKEEEFNDKIKVDGKVLVDCYANWCGPCKVMAPVLEQVADENDTCTFYKLDVDQAEEVSKTYGIMTIPTFLLFENGEYKDKIIGIHSKNEVEEFIK